MQPRIVVFGIGNASRGDDAIGPLLLERLGIWLAAAGHAPEFALIEDYQLQIEHALDLHGKRLALFIDAGCATPVPAEFYAIGATRTFPAPSTHALTPQELLGVYCQVVEAEPPPAFVLCVRGERFELGEGLSVEAQAHVESAWRKLMLLCQRPDAEHWRALAARETLQKGPKGRDGALPFPSGPPLQIPPSQ